MIERKSGLDEEELRLSRRSRMVRGLRALMQVQPAMQKLL